MIEVWPQKSAAEGGQGQPSTHQLWRQLETYRDRRHTETITYRDRRRRQLRRDTFRGAGGQVSGGASTVPSYERAVRARSFPWCDPVSDPVCKWDVQSGRTPAIHLLSGTVPQWARGTVQGQAVVRNWPVASPEAAGRAPAEATPEMRYELLHQGVGRTAPPGRTRPAYGMASMS